MQALLNRVVLPESSRIFRLDGSSTTNPSKFFWEVIGLFEARAKPPCSSWRSSTAGCRLDPP